MTIIVSVEEPANVLEQVERETVAQVLDYCGGNISHAARRLGIHRQVLQRKMTKLGLR